MLKLSDLRKGMKVRVLSKSVGVKTIKGCTFLLQRKFLQPKIQGYGWVKRIDNHDMIDISYSESSDVSGMYTISDLDEWHDQEQLELFPNKDL